MKAPELRDTARTRSRFVYALASPLALAFACTLDLLTHGSAPSPGPGLALLSLCLVIGVAHGLVWDLAFAALARTPRALRVAVWATLAFGLAHQLARALGVYARLGGHYWALALGALGACALGALGLTTLLLCLQPTAADPAGLLAGLPDRWRRRLALGLCCGACVSFYCDTRLYVGLYPALHEALRGTSVWLAMLGLALTQRVQHASLQRHSVTWLFAGVVLATLAWSEQLGVGVRDLHRWPWAGSLVDGGELLSDVDLDGYSSFFAGGDCAPFDARVNPGAVEIPGNGIDDNCLLGDATPHASSRASAPRASEPTTRPPIDVVLITVDALRADHVGVYEPNYAVRGLATTPNLDAFARKARVFEHAYTAGGWTSISISALMRGVYARALELRRVYETNRFRLLLEEQRAELQPRERFAKMFPLPYDDQHPALAQLLTRRGMRTVAVVNDEYTQVLERSSQIASGFSVYRSVDQQPRGRRDDEATAQLAIAELRRIPSTQRFFQWVHFFGPHTPSSAHPGTRLDGAGLVERYDHEIRFMDAQLGELLRAIAKRPTPTAVFVTADHGEEFIGNARHHGYTLDSAVVHVPLIARVPDWPHGRTKGAVSLVDLMPTILELTQTPAPPALPGRSLSEAIHAAAQPARIVFSDTWQFDGRGKKVRAETAAMDGERRAVFDPIRGDFTLVDPDSDDTTPKHIDKASDDRLVRALAEYIESGGAPNLRD